VSIDYEARMREAVYDYQVVTLGSWDADSAEREAYLRRQYRTEQGLATTIANLAMDLGLGREGWSL
jgi:hypothetical protein